MLHYHYSLEELYNCVKFTMHRHMINESSEFIFVLRQKLY